MCLTTFGWVELPVAQGPNVGILHEEIPIPKARDTGVLHPDPRVNRQFKFVSSLYSFCWVAPVSPIQRKDRSGCCLIPVQT